MSAKATERDHSPHAGGSGDDAGKFPSEELRDSPTMARLLGALEAGEDVGHYGRLVFAMVGRHFLPEEELVRLLAAQPDESEERARAMVLQVQGRDYNPPKRERLLEWQSQQEFQLVDADDPDSGNLYRELRFPEGVYEHIQEYYEEKGIGDSRRDGPDREATLRSA